MKAVTIILNVLLVSGVTIDDTKIRALFPNADSSSAYTWSVPFLVAAHARDNESSLYKEVKVKFLAELETSEANAWNTLLWGRALVGALANGDEALAKKAKAKMQAFFAANDVSYIDNSQGYETAAYAWAIGYLSAADPTKLPTAVSAVTKLAERYDLSDADQFADDDAFDHLDNLLWARTMLLMAQAKNGDQEGLKATLEAITRDTQGARKHAEHTGPDTLVEALSQVKVTDFQAWIKGSVAYAVAIAGDNKELAEQLISATSEAISASTDAGDKLLGEIHMHMAQAQLALKTRPASSSEDSQPPVAPK